MKKFVLAVVLMFGMSAVAFAGDQEDFKVWQLEQQMQKIQQEWNETIAKDPKLVELQKKAAEKSKELTAAYEAKKKADEKVKK
jgi:hypothetical protein